VEVAADISKELGYENKEGPTRDDIGLVIMEGLTQEQIRKEAQELYRAEREKTVLRPFTEKYPKIEPAESYRIQLALIEMKKADGAKVVGKKIGLTSKAMQKMLNVDQPDYGHILDGMVLQDGVVFRVGELIQPKIEPEIAFILDREIKGPGVTPIQVLAATRFVVPALEIIDSRIEGWKIKLCDTIADNASSARVVLGSSPKRVDERDLKLVGMILEKNGDIVQTGAGGAVLGHPAVAVAWLANAVGQFGVSLSAGDIIMPGALCGAVDVGAGDLLQASFDGLGTVSVRFV
jgi:2-keto-4-pentenoate hydratase